jgi:DNA-binding transcriptional LysR family regulator
VGARPALRTLNARALMTDELVVAVPAGHPWTGRKTVGLGEVRSEPMIVREPGSGSREALEHALHEAGTNLDAFRVAGEIGSTQAVKQAVRSGVGITIVSRRAVEDECRAGLVHCVKIRDLKVSRSFYLVTHRERTRSPLAEAFVAFVESEAGETAS